MSTPVVIEARPLLLTTKEAMKVMGVGLSTIQQLYMSGEIESVLFGRSRRIVYASLEEWVERNKVRGAA